MGKWLPWALLWLAMVSPRLAEASQPSASQDPGSHARAAGFTFVDGATAQARLEAAQGRGQGSSKPFWIAYAFDVRPGAVVDLDGADPDVREPAPKSDAPAVKKPQAETRNLGVFLLREPGSRTPTRLEVFNLERRREYGGHPVYWIGKMGTEESLKLLRTMVEPSVPQQLAEHAVVAIGLHDGPQVIGLLENLAQSATSLRVRSMAVLELGPRAKSRDLLVALVRDSAQPESLRMDAAHAIGSTRDAAALATLRGLYKATESQGIRKALLEAISANGEAAAANAVLLEIVRTSGEGEARAQAAHWLAETGGEPAVAVLSDAYASERDAAFKRSVLQIFSQIQSPRAEAKLFEIATREKDAALRREAFRALAQRTVQRLSSAQGEAGGPGGSSENVAAGMTKVEEAARRPAGEAVPALLEITRTHQSAAVRNRAILALAETGDPRALEFFESVLKR